MKKLLLAFILLLLLFIAYLLFNTFTFNSNQLEVAAVEKVATPDGAVQRFVNAIAIRTVSFENESDFDSTQFQLFNEMMRSNLTDRISLEEDLKVALAENQFEVYYQPKVNISTMQCTGAEALVRWNHPEKGFVSPMHLCHLPKRTV